MTTWKNEDYQKLAVKAVENFGSSLLSEIPDDAVEWGLTENTNKIEFYANLLGALSIFESNQTPEVKYEESFCDRSGKNVISRGLLQISIESANGYLKRRCITLISDEQELHDPYFNLTLGVIILDRWLASDKVISGGTNDDWRGAARYWSPFRQKDKVGRMKRAVANANQQAINT